MKYAIIDVETTGGLARSERITEIAVVVHDGQKVLETFSTLLNPERSIPWNITMITGITDEMVASAPKFYEVAKRIIELTEGAVFVAHNVAFDYNFVKEEFARLGYTFTRKQLCTVRLSRQVFPGLRSYSLSNLKSHFGIYAEKSHRALDDTLATVEIFQRILAQQNGSENIQTLVNHGVKTAKLPETISIERMHQLPETCGVYYLHDQHGEVIYVGKSINIRKRIFEHFADLSPKGEKLREGVCDFSWEETGSELIALLHESAEIKRLLPRINRAQRTRSFSGGIFAYTDQQGYRCLAPGKTSAAKRKELSFVAGYPKPEAAKAHLNSIARQFELCSKLCNLDAHEQACFHYFIKKCHGACIGEESPESYNERVAAALQQIEKRLEGNFFILGTGRTSGEQSVVAIEAGNYIGYGYFDESFGQFTTEDLLECIAPPRQHDPEAGRIIRGFLDGKKGVRVVGF